MTSYDRVVLKKSVMTTLLIWISAVNIYDCYLLTVPSFDPCLDELNPIAYWLIDHFGIYAVIAWKLIGTVIVVSVIPRLKHRWSVVLIIAGLQTLLLWFLCYG